MSQKELNGLTRRQNIALTLSSILVMIVSFAVLRSIDPLHLFGDNERLFSSINEVLYVGFAFAIGYIPIGIVNIIKRRLV